MDASIQAVQTNGASTVVARIEHRYGSEELFFRSRNAELIATPDALVALALIPAMYLNEPLRIDQGVSESVFANVGRLQTLLNAFHPVLHQVEFSSSPTRDVTAPHRGVACFFSGGVDSFYSTLRHRDELDALVHIRGFDAPVDRDDIFEVVLPPLRRAADDLGLPLVEVETNLKSFSDRFVNWPYHYYGAALATVGQLLSGSFRRFYMAGGYNYAMIPATGAHPLLDSLWGASAVEFVYDGGEASRSQKAAFLASSEAARRAVRVCGANTGEYNCCRCNKCVFTMAALRGARVLELFSAFPKPLDLDAFSRIDLTHPLSRFRVNELLTGIEDAGGDLLLEEAILKPLLRIAEEDYLKRTGDYTGLPLDRFSSSNGGRIMRRGRSITVETPTRVWAYAAALPLRAALARAGIDDTTGRVAILRFRIRAEGASVGVGVTNRDGSDFLARVEVQPAANFRYVYLRVADLAEAGELIVQTWNQPLRGRLAIESIEVQFLPRLH